MIHHKATGPMSMREHIGLGIAYGYPFCCVIRWSLGTRRGGRAQATERGSIPTKTGGQFVPCGVFHRAAK